LTTATSTGDVAVVGWSMGGLVAMMAARQAPPRALVVIEPRAPAEVQGWHPEVPLQSGVFDPEQQYGRFPSGMMARPESLRARAERKRGISVPSIPCPLLVVHGADYGHERGRLVAECYDAAELAFPLLHHFELIQSLEVRDSILRWLGRQ